MVLHCTLTNPLATIAAVHSSSPSGPGSPFIRVPKMKEVERMRKFEIAIQNQEKIPKNKQSVQVKWGYATSLVIKTTGTSTYSSQPISRLLSKLAHSADNSDALHRNLCTSTVTDRTRPHGSTVILSLRGETRVVVYKG